MDVYHIRYLEKFTTLPKLVPCDFQPDRNIIRCTSQGQGNNAGSTLLTFGHQKPALCIRSEPLEYLRTGFEYPSGGFWWVAQNFGYIGYTEKNTLPAKHRSNNASFISETGVFR